MVHHLSGKNNIKYILRFYCRFSVIGRRIPHNDQNTFILIKYLNFCIYIYVIIQIYLK